MTYVANSIRTGYKLSIRYIILNVIGTFPCKYAVNDNMINYSTYFMF